MLCKTCATIKHSDLRVIKSFADRQPNDTGSSLETDGKKLDKLSYPHYTIAIWRGLYCHIGNQAEITSYGTSVIRQLKKYIAPAWFIYDYEYKDKVQAITFTSESDSYYKDQFDETIYAHVPGEDNPVGFLHWALYKGEYSISMVEVVPKYKRTGIATALYKELFRKEKITQRDLQPSMQTEEGAAFRRGLVASKTARSSMLQNLNGLKHKMAAAAQLVYDDWEQDEDGVDEHYGEGGICDDIADAIGSVVQQAYDYNVYTHYCEYDTHTSLYIHNEDLSEICYVDIHPTHYESGYGYKWKKIHGVTLTADMIDIEDVSHETHIRDLIQDED